MPTSLYIPVIEAAKYHIPVLCEDLGNNKFRILESNMFELDDDTVLYQFIPGDIVEATVQNLKDFNGNASMQITAFKLISSPFKSRNLRTLQYLITDQQGMLTERQLQDYGTDIDDLKEKITLNKADYKIDFHPAVLRWYDLQSD